MLALFGFLLLGIFHDAEMQEALSAQKTGAPEVVELHQRRHGVVVLQERQDGLDFFHEKGKSVAPS